MGAAMAYWLMKSEPDHFGIDHLEQRPQQTEPWDRTISLHELKEQAEALPDFPLLKKGQPVVGDAG